MKIFKIILSLFVVALSMSVHLNKTYAVTCVRVDAVGDYYYQCDGIKVTQTARTILGDEIRNFINSSTEVSWLFYDGLRKISTPFSVVIPIKLNCSSVEIKLLTGVRKTPTDSWSINTPFMTHGSKIYAYLKSNVTTDKRESNSNFPNSIGESIIRGVYYWPLLINCNNGNLSYISGEIPPTNDINYNFNLYNPDFDPNKGAFIKSFPDLLNKKGDDKILYNNPEAYYHFINNIPVCQSTSEICDGLDNDCDTFIDEGGVCATCTDNIKNGDENGVDCGGSCTKVCTIPSGCTDGIKNGTEIGIDCGGQCLPCLSCTGFFAGEWSDCINGQQTRTVLEDSPKGCTGLTKPNSTKKCDSPVSPIDLVTMSSVCSYSQSSSTKVYVNTQMQWSIDLTGYSLKDISTQWTGTNISTTEKIGNTFDKIYTTVGLKNISATTTAKSIDGLINYVFTCSTSTNVIIGGGSINEI